MKRKKPQQGPTLPQVLSALHQPVGPSWDSVTRCKRSTVGLCASLRSRPEAHKPTTKKRFVQRCPVFFSCLWVCCDLVGKHLDVWILKATSSPSGFSGLTENSTRLLRCLTKAAWGRVSGEMLAIGWTEDKCALSLHCVYWSHSGCAGLKTNSPEI